MKEGVASFFRGVWSIYAYRTDGASICAYRVDRRFHEYHGRVRGFSCPVILIYAYRTKGLSLCAYRVIHAYTFFFIFFYFYKCSR